MNRPIRIMSIFCMLLFLALLANSTYLQYFQANALDAHHDNKRVRDAEYSRKRGAILVAGRSIAVSKPVKDEFKYLRAYPEARQYAHLTGYYSYIYGSNALEYTQNAILSGSDPRLFVNRLSDLFGNSAPKGGSVTLTINPRAQKAAFDGLKALGPHTEGAVVALNPSTGAILAMTSTPSYDPNKLASHNFDQVEKAWKKLNANKNQPLLNRAIQQTYPPGSTFKLVTTAAALSSGRFTPQSLVPGGTSLDLPQTTTNLVNENGMSCGGNKITLTQALVVSCNVSYGYVGLTLGADTLRKQAQKFGFGQHYFGDLNGQVASQFPQHADPPQTALSAIGQYDVAATPLQMAMVAAGIADGGTVMKPYLVDEVRAPDLSVLNKTTPQPLHSHVVTPRVAHEITQMMEAVVQYGTGTTAQIPGIKVAGKTGTAQTTPSRPPYAWFVCFAPADNPKVAVAVLIQNAHITRSEISGSHLAAPIAKAVMQAVIQ